MIIDNDGDGNGDGNNDCVGYGNNFDNSGGNNS